MLLGGHLYEVSYFNLSFETPGYPVCICSLFLKYSSKRARNIGINSPHVMPSI